MHHSPAFDIDEEALRTGTRVLVDGAIALATPDRQRRQRPEGRCRSGARPFDKLVKGEHAMCPSCISTMTLAVVGSTSTGGLVAWLAGALLRKRTPRTSTEEGN